MDSDADTQVEPLDLGQALATLADTSKPLRWKVLYQLSNIEGKDLSQFNSKWAQIDAERRKEIMETLGSIAVERYDLIFRQVSLVALKDPVGDVRAAAVNSLAMEEEAALIEPLIKILQDDAHAKARSAAARCLGTFVYLGVLEEITATKSKIVEDALLIAEDTDESLTVRQAALESLGYSSLAAVPERIQIAWQTPDEDWQASALRAMGRSTDSHRWDEQVYSALEHSSEQIQIEAARAAGELELQSAEMEVAELIYSTCAELQSVAIWALGEIGGGKARSALLELQAVAEDDDEIQDLVSEALANIELMGAVLDSGVLDAGNPNILMDSLDEEIWH